MTKRTETIRETLCRQILRERRGHFQHVPDDVRAFLDERARYVSPGRRHTFYAAAMRYWALGFDPRPYDNGGSYERAWSEGIGAVRDAVERFGWGPDGPPFLVGA